MARRMNAQALKRALLRSNTKLLMTVVMLFQATGMLLLAFKRDPIDTQALIMAAVLPLGTYLTVNLYSRLWQVDRALMILFLFLCSVGLITLQDIARAAITPLSQAVYVLAGLVSMAIGIVLMRVLRRYDRYLYWVMGLSLLFLVLPLVMGDWQNGAKNWIRLGRGEGAPSLQPSEFVKLALILCLAAGLSGRPRLLKCLPVVAYAALLCVLLLMARDLGALHQKLYAQ